MLFCIVNLHAGIVPAIITFLLWSLPGAIGMFGLALGVQQINEVLPAPAYAFLSGLNASTVGIVALAAVQVGLLPGLPESSERTDDSASLPRKLSKTA
jgi:chromate transport protein ChrA